MGRRTVKLSLPSEVADWLSSQPGGGEGLVEQLVRERMAGREALTHRLVSLLSPAVRELAGRLAQDLWGPQAPSAEAVAALRELEKVDPSLLERASKLARYPQLIEAVARGLVTIDRAEAMAEEADARA